MPYQREERYKIVRYFFNGRKRILNAGLTLEQAQHHCNNPETSSTTCKRTVNRNRTIRLGPWFDAYTKL